MPAIIRCYLQKRREGRRRWKITCEILHWPHPQERNPTGRGYDMLSERGRIPLGNFDVNKKPTYGSVIIGTESRDISRESYVTLARSFLVVLGSSPLWEKINRFVRCLWKRCCRIQWWNQELNSRGWRKRNRIICNYLKIALRLKMFASNGRKWLIRLSGVFGNYWLQWWIIFIEELRGYWNGHSKNEKRVCDFRICRDCLFKVKKKKYCWL